jgi:SRSO17 transposase
MIARAIAAKVPFSFVAADSVYGTGEIETLLRQAGKGYVLGVASNHVFHSWGKQPSIAGTASAIAQSLPKKAWRRLPSGEGSKGPCWHDWAYLELADLDVSEYNDDLAGEWTRGLLIRRNIADGSLAFSPHGAPRARPYRSWCPWKAIAGPSRTASKPPRTNSALITTKPARGMAGIAMSHSSCLPSP